MRVAIPQTLSPHTLSILERDLAQGAQASVWMLCGACQGMDLDAFVESEDALANLRRFGRLLATIRTAPCPTIALVTGPAIGGGVGIAAACDVVVAERTATFALPEALFGLLPGVVVPVLSHRMSAHAIHLLALLGTAKSAAWAERVGLVDEVTDQVEQRAMSWKRLLLRADRRRVAELREWTSCARSLAPMDALERGAERTARAGSDPQVKRVVRAFLEEGDAPWQR